MYNGQLEELIEAALTDGVLTEKEKQVLFKKAESLGIDLDEFEMVLDSRLQKMQQQQKSTKTSSAPQSGKVGQVRKCPACGAMVGAMDSSCKECGFEFIGVENTSSVRILTEKIDEIIQKYANKTKSSDDDNFAYERHNEIKSTILNFPIPSNKNDLLEFILYLNKKNEYDCADKYNECLDKARILYGNDPLFQRFFNEAEKERRQKTFAIILLIIGIIAGVFLGIWVGSLCRSTFWSIVAGIFSGLVLMEICMIPLMLIDVKK